MKKTLKTISNIRRKRKHGFRKRSRSRWGRKILRRRRKRGKAKLAV